MSNIYIRIEEYDPTTWKRPWIGRVGKWQDGHPPTLEWGYYEPRLGSSTYDGKGGTLVISGENGEVFLLGQTHRTDPKQTIKKWCVITNGEQGDYKEISYGDAQQAWRDWMDRHICEHTQNGSSMTIISQEELLEKRKREASQATQGEPSASSDWSDLK